MASREESDLVQLLAPQSHSPGPEFALDDGSRVAVVGGGPAGSFVSYFMLDMARRLGLDLNVDLYEPRDYTRSGPASCNHCGGIVSESLVQLLATEGISLPNDVVQRGLDSYVLHMGVGQARIDTPLQEKRIAAIHRGAGPRGVVDSRWRSFDGYLQQLAVDSGADMIVDRVAKASLEDGHPQLETRSGSVRSYDLLVGAVGVNTKMLEQFESLGIGYRPPETTKTYICEFPLGEETVSRYLGNSMHVFLLDLPRLEFGALIPKGEFVTVCLLGEEIDKELVDTFLNTPDVKGCLPPGWQVPKVHCHCSPQINIGAAIQPFADRIVLVGDCGVSRLYKDGIGAAYRTAKAAANTAVFHGVAAADFRKHYLPVVKGISSDNRFGKVIFTVTGLIQKLYLGRRAVLRMVTHEQKTAGKAPLMSMVMWDTFTGSAAYREIFFRGAKVSFLGSLAWHALAATVGAVAQSLCSVLGRRATPPAPVAE